MDFTFSQAVDLPSFHAKSHCSNSLFKDVTIMSMIAKNMQQTDKLFSSIHDKYSLNAEFFLQIG